MATAKRTRDDRNAKSGGAAKMDGAEVKYKSPQSVSAGPRRQLCAPVSSLGRVAVVIGGIILGSIPPYPKDTSAPPLPRDEQGPGRVIGANADVARSSPGVAPATQTNGIRSLEWT